LLAKPRVIKITCEQDGSVPRKILPGAAAENVPLPIV
jgi:hypothetical protein